jgi:hypothetical protein
MKKRSVLSAIVVFLLLISVNVSIAKIGSESLSEKNQNSVLEIKYEEIPQTLNGSLRLIGDFNQDSKVRFDDLLDVLTNWGLNNLEYDEDGDGSVGQSDLKILLENWGEGRMLKADIFHSQKDGHCRVTEDEVQIVQNHIGANLTTTQARLSDLDQDGAITENDVLLMETQRALAFAGGYGTDIREDLNCDGVVTQKDVKLVYALWGQKDYAHSWADITGDSMVDEQDLEEVENAM